jgi:hypothetical protein
MMSFFDFSVLTINKIYNFANFILIIGAVLVAIGTIAAIWSAGIRERYADERISANEAETERAKESAALANERTAEANLQIEKLKKQMAGRRLTKEQHAALIDNLKGKNIDLIITSIAIDPEASLYRDDFILAFSESNIRYKYINLIEPCAGIEVKGRTDNDFSVLKNALEKAKIPFIPIQDNNFRNLKITIGSKPLISP